MGDTVLPGRRIYGADVGIVLMDRRLPRPVGDAGNALSFPFPVVYETLPTQRRLPYLAPAAAAELYPLFLETCRRLVDHGVRAISSTCGFAAIYQRRLAAELPVPVAVSGLLHIPTALALLPEGSRLGVLTARTGALTPDHFHGCGIDDARQEALTVIGLDGSEHWREVILDMPGTAPLHLPSMTDQVVAVCERAQRADPALRGFVAECGNVGPYSAAIRARTGLPVWDTIGLVTNLAAGVTGDAAAARPGVTGLTWRG